MKAAILGFDREGRSTLDSLKRSQEFRNAEIWILDKNKNLKAPKGLRVSLGPDYLSKLSDFDIVFRTPGAPYLLPEIQKAKKRGVIISSSTKLFFEEAERMRPRPLIVGVTGTKGKGTTSTLLWKMLKAGGRNAYLAGNVGTPALKILPKLKAKGAIAVLELSSFQLQDLERSPRIAVVLDMFPDHLDVHKNLREYYGAKANIARFQKSDERVFFLKRNRWSKWVASHGRGKKVAVDPMTFRLFSPGDLRMPGPHNFQNAVMAATVARKVGVPAAAIVRTVRKFSGTEHRLEFVRKIGGARFYNDSASTNPRTMAAALASFPGENIILIDCGRPKVRDYRAVRIAAKRSTTKFAVLFGETKNMTRTALKNTGVEIVSASGLAEALQKAYRLSRRFPSSVVLFSPSGTSFDMFKNYAERGTRFKALVKKLKEVPENGTISLMSFSITRQELEHLAELGRIELDPKEEEKLLKDIGNMLEHFKELENLKTSDVAPVTGGSDLKNVFREDDRPENTNRGVGVDAFPESENGFLKVPPVFE